MKEYKYKIHYHLQKLTVEDYKIAKDFLPKMLGCTKYTFKKWVYIKAGSKREIPIDSLQRLADFFGIKLDDLMTHKITGRQMVLEFEIFKKQKLCSQ